MQHLHKNSKIVYKLSLTSCKVCFILMVTLGKGGYYAFIQQYPKTPV